MRYPNLPTCTTLFLLVALADPSAAQVRHRNGGDDAAAGQAVPRSEAPAPAPSAAPATAPTRSPEQAVERSAPRTVETGDGSRAAAQTNQGARPRGGNPTVGVAVPRPSSPSRPGGGAPGAPAPYYYPYYPYYPYHPYYGGYSPWAFGGVGFGFSYYGGIYSPYVYGGWPWYGYGYGPYGYPPAAYGYPSVYSYPADGDLRLKIKPRNAEVFVDGYYVGVVDDFDGAFQRLHLPSGPHRIETRAPGYETLTFDVQIRFADTTTYEKQMQSIK